MNVRSACTVAAAVGIAGAVLPLAGAGMAQAAPADGNSGTEGSGPATGYPSTQSPVQGPTALLATADNALASIMDANGAATGSARPDEANGTETRYPEADPRYVEGPVGGALLNGPFE